MCAGFQRADLAARDRWPARRPTAAIWAATAAPTLAVTVSVLVWELLYIGEPPRSSEWDAHRSRPSVVMQGVSVNFAVTRPQMSLAIVIAGS
jgi:hypothetical protein